MPTTTTEATSSTVDAAADSARGPTDVSAAGTGRLRGSCLQRCCGAPRVCAYGGAKRLKAVPPRLRQETSNRRVRREGCASVPLPAHASSGGS
jgi:hypothetical protein